MAQGIALIPGEARRIGRVVSHVEATELDLTRGPKRAVETADDRSVVVEIESYATGGGKYYAWLVDGTISPASSTWITEDLGFMEGGTTHAADRNAVVINLAENATSQHSLRLGSFHVGLRFGITNDSDKFPIIAIGSSTAGFFPVKVELYGGSNGTSSTKASYTYTISTLADVELESEMAPKKPRAIGSVIYQQVANGDAMVGSAYFDEDGELQLYDAGEVMDVTTC